MKPVAVTIATAVAACLLPAPVLGHGYMNIPTGRTTDTINDMDDTGVCDSSEPGTVTEFESGETIQVQWSRNNHIGGFIRFSLAPKDDATKETFDSSAFYYVCREVDCDLKECGDNKYCGDDSGAADNEIKCGTNITLPNYYEAGDYVLQWTWFAAGSSYGHIGWTTGNYRTCADIKLTTSGTATKPSCPTYVGGDRVTEIEGKSSDQCFYFDTNDLVKKEVQYDDDTGYTRYLYGVPAEVESCSGGSPSNSTTTAPSSSSSTPVASSGSGDASTATSAAEDWDSEGNGESSTSSSTEDWDSENNGDASNNYDWSNADENSEGGWSSNADESSNYEESSNADENSNGEGWEDNGSEEVGNEADSSASTDAEATPEATSAAPTGGCRAKSSRK